MQVKRRFDDWYVDIRPSRWYLVPVRRVNTGYTDWIWLCFTLHHSHYTTIVSVPDEGEMQDANR